jgi:hypothetical protein
VKFLSHGSWLVNLKAVGYYFPLDPAFPSDSMSGKRAFLSGLGLSSSGSKKRSKKIKKLYDKTCVSSLAKK